MTTLADFGPGVAADSQARPLASLVAPLRRSLSDMLLYRRTLAELRALSPRQREDLGFAGRDLAAIARQAVYA